MSEEAMVRRRDAAQATLDRFKDVPLRLGRNDCARLVAYHLRKLGWSVKLPPSGSYASVRSARREMEKLGYKTLEAALDSFGFERIPPAAAVVGDVVMLPADTDLGSLTVCMGNGRVCGYHEDAAGAVVMQPIEHAAAWRVTPR
nr:hypothetical protein [uncultured organism]